MSQVKVKEPVRRNMTVAAIIEEKPKSQHIYAVIEGEMKLVWCMKLEPDHAIVMIWGDDINNLEPISLPLLTELIVL